MTREELRNHCEKQIRACEMWAHSQGEEPHGKVYEEHKLILELLEQEPCEDAISRKALIERINNAEENFKADNMESIGSDDGDPFVDGVLSGVFNIREMVIQAPSVTPQEPFKPMVEIYLYSVVKQKYIEREVLDKIRAEIEEETERDDHADDTYDITIHCTSQEEQEKAEKALINSISREEIEKAYESIMDVAEGGYVDIEKIKVHFCKLLGIEDK